jgi:hypothetical protein
MNGICLSWRHLPMEKRDAQKSRAAEFNALAAGRQPATPGIGWFGNCSLWHLPALLALLFRSNQAD